MTEKQRTKKCPYCEGKGKFFHVDNELATCPDCRGTGQRCILCCRPASDCECPPSAFDGDYSGMDRPRSEA